MARIHLTLLLACLLALALPRFFGQSTAPPPAPEPPLEFYLLIGGSHMAGQAEIASTDPIDRAFLLNDTNTWEPAREPLNRYATTAQGVDARRLGPAASFARHLLNQDAEAKVGLILQATSGTTIDDWLGKAKYYWGARGRTKAAAAQGTLKGIIWFHGESDIENPAAYADSLRTLIANLRADLHHASLPVIIGQVPGQPDLNAALVQLTQSLHATATVPIDGLTTLPGGTHLDAASQHTLGIRFAEKMLTLQAAAAQHTPKPPADIRFIDPHVHAMAVTPIGLRAVAKWMDERNIERCIVSPLNHKGSRPQSEQERQIMLENFRPYRGRIDRMTIIDPGEVETVQEAIAILQREKNDGAIAFGEHYGKGLMFDDPKNLLLYEACEKVGLPVMFHIDQNQNKVEHGMERVDRVLRMFPDCKIVAHAYWWRQLGNGTCDRQLTEHPNLYADMSGIVVVNLLNRDRAFAREFIIRHQDKLLWATDEGWWSFADSQKQMNLHYTLFEELDLPDEVRHKIYRGNAQKVYGLSP